LDRIERLANHPDLCARMGRRSREIGEARFDMQKNANHIADMLVEMYRGAWHRPLLAGRAGQGLAANGGAVRRRG
jgi:hypothetical protein